MNPRQVNFGKWLGGALFYGLIPKVLVVVHTALLIWVLVGTIVIFFERDYIGTHIILISLVIIFGLFLGYCPLTKLEEVLRRKRDSRFTLNNSFMTFYVNKVFRTHFSVAQINGFQIFMFIFSYAAAFFLYFLR